ncbi:MAG: helix-turn-helix domain-containing protein [Labilithrix sp.]|nr:helix-turn-helix domain-containing protein [Labilithrix sp.]MCW5810041.1 helix-turn-helix domain-containing protein [Labilithrix sp.]
MLVVGGGRGGAGKSLVAQNLAVYFAQLGKSVILVDLDPTGANIHAQFGLSAAVHTPDETEKELAKSLVATNVPGLSILPGAHDAIEPPLQLRAGRKARWLSRLRALPADYLVIDVGPGHSHLALDMMLAADIGICVTVPEPPAIEATYRFVRAAYRRRLRRSLAKDRFRLSLVDRAIKEIGRLPSPLDLLRILAKSDRSLAELGWAEAHRMRLYLAVNQTRVRTDLELASAMSSLARAHYGLALEELGHIEHDDTVWLAVRRKRPILVDSPTSKAARNIERIARRVVALTTSAKMEPREAPPPLLPALAPPDHYTVLGIGRAANDEEIRRAFKRQREIYATGGLATSSLLDEHELGGAQARIDEAHDTLLDPVRRRAYDLSMFPEPEQPASMPPPRPALAAEQLLLQGELQREIGPDTEFTGPLLRKVRESQGIEVAEISARTKISKVHLVALEEESYEQLPAVVYVRGFVTELAKYLRLDPAQVQRTYMRRMREREVS